MSSLIQEATIKIRQDTSGNWSSENPTPLSGEWCLETDTGLVKIGDGSTAWDTLDYYVDIGTAGQVLTSNGEGSAPSMQSRGVPSGAIQSCGMESAPSGWLECDGSNVNRSTYSDLWDAIGTNYGEGNGSTTFTLPDMRGKFLRGWDDSQGNDPDAAGRTAQSTGGQSGDNVGSVQADAFQGHTFNIDRRAVYDISGGSVGKHQDSSPTNPSEIISDGINGEPRTTSETRPKNVSVMYIIKT